MTSLDIADLTIHNGDCRDVLRGIPDDSIDSCVTDPPYALVSIVKRFGGAGAAPAKGNEAYIRASAGFMGKQWDTGETAFSIEFWAEVYRVLKPGAHVAAFGASRGYHRMACAIEDAGFEIRDSLMWVYGTGFPKSHNVALSIDKGLGAVGNLAKSFNMKGGGDRASEFAENGRDQSIRHIPTTPQAQAWEGWGTALKPAFEPIVLARKPLIGTIAANVLRWGTGALNVDGCRIEAEGGTRRHGEASQDRRYAEHGSTNFAALPGPRGGDPAGRWPANVVHDGSDEVVRAFPDSKGQQGDVRGTEPSGVTDEIYGKYKGRVRSAARTDSGSAARFFYSAKASKADRGEGNKHPTVKPTSLMEWLCRLITPPGGVVLDPFMGSGSTGKACHNEGFRFVGVEREEEYFDMSAARLWEHING